MAHVHKFVLVKQATYKAWVQSTGFEGPRTERDQQRPPWQGVIGTTFGFDTEEKAQAWAQENLRAGDRFRTDMYPSDPSLEICHCGARIQGPWFDELGFYNPEHQYTNINISTPYEYTATRDEYIGDLPK